MYILETLHMRKFSITVRFFPLDLLLVMLPSSRCCDDPLCPLFRCLSELSYSLFACRLCRVLLMLLMAHTHTVFAVCRLRLTERYWRLLLLPLPLFCFFTFDNVTRSPQTLTIIMIVVRVKVIQVKRRRQRKVSQEAHCQEEYTCS